MGTIKTAWHRVSIQAVGNNRQSTVGGNAFGQKQSYAQKQYFVRFRVYVRGGTPWQVRVYGQASVWNAGGVPALLKGGDIPPWLKGRTDALRVDIYRRLKHIAVVPVKAKAPQEKVVTLSNIAKLPKGAQKRLHEVYTAIRKRSFDSLEPLLAPDLHWSYDASGDRKMALLMWRAHGHLWDRMQATLRGNCLLLNPTHVSCSSKGDRLLLEKHAQAWVLTHFILP